MHLTAVRVWEARRIPKWYYPARLTVWEEFRSKIVKNCKQLLSSEMIITVVITALFME